MQGSGGRQRYQILDDKVEHLADDRDDDDAENPFQTMGRMAKWSIPHTTHRKTVTDVEVVSGHSTIVVIQKIEPGSTGGFSRGSPPVASQCLAMNAPV
jgi:hypothetical protein